MLSKIASLLQIISCNFSGVAVVIKKKKGNEPSVVSAIKKPDPHSHISEASDKFAPT